MRISTWPIALILALIAWRCAATTVSTDDGLNLRFAAGGDIEAVAVDGAELPSGGLLGGFWAAEVTAGGEELVANGGLEQDADEDGVPDGFVSGGVWERDGTVARSGEWSMRAHIPGPEDGNSGSFGVIVPVDGGGTYLASFWLKCEGRGGHYGTSSGYLQQRDAEGNRTTNVFQQMMGGGVSGDSDWRRVSVAVTTEGDTRRLYIRTDIYRGHGTLWADDFSIIRLGAPARHLPTRATQDGDGLRLSGRDQGLEIDATVRPGGSMLRLDGTLRSTEPRDRCIRLSWRLPIAAEGGTWWNDIGTAKAIEPGGAYSYTAPLGSHGPFSIHPFSSVAMPDRSAALSMAVPMHPPRPFRLSYSAAAGLCVEWDLALSELPEAFPRSADFHAVVYRHDPEWGLRSAAERYYELFPEYFNVRVPKFGNWYYADLSELERPEDFGLAYNEYIQRGTAEADHEWGNLVFGYTEPWGWWGWALGLHPQEEDPQPGYDEMVAILEEKAADEEALAEEGMNPTRVAHTIINSSIRDREGRYVFKGYVARWGGYNWILNPSPHAVEEGKLSRFEVTYDWEIERKLGWGADGIYLDSITKAWTAVPNFRAEHLRRSRHPLTFNALDAVPAQLGVWNQYEFVQHVSEDLHGRGKLLMANIFPYNWVFFNHLLDVMGHEVWGADNLDRMRVERTLAYHKPYCWLMQQGDDFGAPEDRERWMQAAMLYGIAPNIVGGTRDVERYERWRPLYRRYMPTIIALCEAGWEPVTHARADSPELLLERFGPRDGALYLTARNPGEEPLTATVSVDWRRLGVEPGERVSRLPSGVEIEVAGGAFTDTLQSGETCAYRLR